MFDFDGTLSLIRAGWQDVMVPMMVDVLAELGTGESREELTRLVRDFVDELTGKQTIFQMIRLAEEVRKRGGTPKDPLDYKREYLDRLMERIRHRREGLAAGSVAPDDLMVPGARGLLESLRERQLDLYLASGTDEQYVHEEAALLHVTDYFTGGIYGALDDYKRFSKAMVIRTILETRHLGGQELVCFGDGFEEIENTKEVGGVAVGVASEERRREGIDQWKRQRLIRAGADLIIPDYRQHRSLLQLLFADEKE